MTRMTIITPSYNQAAYLPATIASVLSQDYADFEYLIFDGGSTDGSVAILRAQTDPRLKWVSEKDGGQSHALNNGLRAATGEIITYINSDDTLLPGALRFAVAYFAAHPDADLLHGDCDAIDAAGAPMPMMTSAPFALGAMLTGQHPNIHQPGTFWRRRVTEAIGAFDEAMQFSFDADYWIRASLAGFRIDYVPGTRAQYRFHDASKSVSQTDRFYDDWCRIVEKVFADSATPDSVLRLRAEVDTQTAWTFGKIMWRYRRYDVARPLLLRSLRSPRLTRRLMAALMLIETVTGTRLTKIVAAVFSRADGYQMSGF